MGILELLEKHGFDRACKAKMVRHQDSRPGVDFDAVIRRGLFSEYQSWQLKPIFDDLDYIVSFRGDGGGRARFMGVFTVVGSEHVPYDELPRDKPWGWHHVEPHYRYELEKAPGYEELEDEVVVAWSGERTWVQNLHDYEVLEGAAED